MIGLIDFNDEIEQFWQGANHNILWGWKRDVGQNSRVVFFSGNLERHGQQVSLSRHFFHYSSRMNRADFSLLEPHFSIALSRLRADGLDAKLSIERRGELINVRLGVGRPTEADKDKVTRLHLRRPRRRIAEGTIPTPQALDVASTVFPADVYVGSGVSYEAGLPTLCDMHECFGVDSEMAVGFASGADDPLPEMLAREGIGRVKEFCTLHVQALSAAPTSAMLAIAQLQKQGRIGNIYTDNVDNMLSKVGVGFERVRGSGVFNERHPVTFASKTLIVVGVAADRRQIVRQARGKGLKIVVVNPISKVSPNVTHLEYVRAGDTFFRTTAKDFFDVALRGSNRVEEVLTEVVA